MIYMRIKITLIMIIIISFTTTTCCFGISYRNDEIGYSLDLPADWIEIPTSIIKAELSMALSDDKKGSIRYDAAFQLENNTNWFTHPYVVVEIIDYSIFGMNRELGPSDYAEIAAYYATINSPTNAVKYLSADAKKKIDYINTGNQTYESSKHQFRLPIIGKRAGVGLIRGECLGHFGKKALINVSFYAQNDEWHKHNIAKEYIFSSLRLDTDSKSLITSDPEVLPSNTNSLGNKFIVGLTVGVVLFAISALLEGISTLNKRLRNQQNR
jgi:hypothetical protein